MNRNPIIPFVLIMVFGIGLIFFLSFMGLENRQERAEGGEGEGTDNALLEASPEEIYQQAGCISCHGANYSDGSAPSLLGVGEKYSADDIKDILSNGIPPAMPGGLVPDEKLDEMAEWLLTLE